jgi:prepilin peptidase CpaA
LRFAAVFMTTDLLALPAAVLLVYAALHDFAARTVPNWLSVCVLLFGLAIRLADHTFLAGLGVCAVTFALLFVVWMLGGVGGGDVKLWAATAMLIPPDWQPELTFFLRVIILGGLLALFYLALSPLVRRLRARRPRAPEPGGAPRGLLRRVLRVEAWRIRRRAPLPYAFAIAGSAILTLIPLSLQR